MGKTRFTTHLRQRKGRGDLARRRPTSRCFFCQTHCTHRLGGFWRGMFEHAQYRTQEQLVETSGDEDTVLPPDLKPPAHWHREDEQSEEG
jgi:hypothetical protein